MWVMSNAGLLLIAFGILSFSLSISRADDLGSLIDLEVREKKKWDHEEGDMPPTFLFGDKEGVEIYSQARYRGEENVLCDPLEFDNLIDVSLKTYGEETILLNLSLPQVREVLSQKCLVRPGDSFLAVGPSWQIAVSVKDFVVKKEVPVCAEDYPYGLWVSFSKELPSDPLFYTSLVNVKEGENGFRSSKELEEKRLEPESRGLLAEKVAFLDDYEITIYDVQAPNCQQIFWLRRKGVSLEDEGLFNEVILSRMGNKFEILMAERVDRVEGSGHVRLSGVLDYNGDGFLDIFLRGDKAGCFYKALFDGVEGGLEYNPLPNRPCSC